MEDLLASIRKIIADDAGERLRPALRAAPPPPPGRGREPRRAADVDAEVSATVEQSMLDAFGAVDAEPDEPRGAARSAAHGVPAYARSGEWEHQRDIEAAVHSIAEAIAAERLARPRSAASGDLAGDWSGDVLGEPGLDRPSSTRPALGDLPRVAPLSSAGRLQGLARPEGAERTARPEREPAEPLPRNVYRLDPAERTSEMTDAAVDPKLQDGDGNVFRRPAPARADPDDGLTSARTRQSVSAQLDQLSRTILTNNPRTLEDLVRDMVRPLLREWLEANLPDIVERQVRQEIERVSARGR